MSEPRDDRALPAPVGLRGLRNAALFMAVVLALSLIRFFSNILSPLVVAAFMIALTDGVSRSVHKRLPTAPPWLRGGLAGATILAAFAFIAGVIFVEAPPFAVQIKALAPKIDVLLIKGLTSVGAPPMTIEHMLRSENPEKLAGPVFATLRHFTSFVALVLIYFGFLAASRATSSRKIERFDMSADQRASVERIFASVAHAVDRYTWLQTLKALSVAAVAWILMSAMGVHDALIAAFLVFLSAFVPIVGAVIGSVFPGLLALAQFSDFTRPLMMVAVLASAVFVIDNVVMPKLQGDELNLDPLFVLLSLGFWAAILGAPGVLLSTPLTVTVMAIAAEFETTRWVAVLLSRDGLPQSLDPRQAD